jgi:Glycine-zipper domain
MKRKSDMNNILRFLLFFSLTIIQYAFAQQTQAPATLPDTSKLTYNQISSGLKLYSFPAKGQSKEQQKADEFECYKWAMEQSGIDPLNLPKVEAAPVKTGATGGAVKGAARGAAAGAAIGAITDDAGTGAAVGAASGAVAGRRAGKKAQAQQKQQAEATAAQKEQEMKNSFVKAFSACIKGKGYTVE